MRVIKRAARPIDSHQIIRCRAIYNRAKWVKPHRNPPPDDGWHQSVRWSADGIAPFSLPRTFFGIIFIILSPLLLLLLSLVWFLFSVFCFRCSGYFPYTTPTPCCFMVYVNSCNSTQLERLWRLSAFYGFSLLSSLSFSSFSFLHNIYTFSRSKITRERTVQKNLERIERSWGNCLSQR